MRVRPCVGCERVLLTAHYCRAYASTPTIIHLPALAVLPRPSHAVSRNSAPCVSQTISQPLVTLVGVDFVLFFLFGRYRVFLVGQTEPQMQALEPSKPSSRATHVSCLATKREERERDWVG